MSTVQTTAPRAAASPHKRSWVARHKILTALGVLLVLALVAGYIWGWPLVEWRFHRLFVNSLEEIQHSPTAVAKLGEPISIPTLPLPNGRVFTDGKNGEARFDFAVIGPKDKAEVVSLMRMVDGKWGYSQLKLTFPDNSTIDLSQAIQQRDGDEMPKFDPNAKQIEVQQPNLKIDVTLPDLPPEPEKK